MLKLKYSLVLGAVLACVSASSFAAMNSYSLADDLQHTPDNRVRGYFGGLYNGLSGDVARVPGNKYNFDFEFDYRKDVPKEHDIRLTAAARANDVGLIQYTVPEVYVANRWGRSEFIMGRQILDWSMVDAGWGFGKLNNRRNFDFFVPGQEGLIGVQLRRRYSNGLRYHFFASPIYVPEMNPGLDIDEDKKTIKSRAPWGDAPATTADVQGNERTIQYIVDYPEINEVIWRPGGGLNIGWESKHWLLDAFFMRKPENQLSQKVDVSFDPVLNVVKANIKPEFYYHDLYGGNIRYKNLDVEIYFSGIAVRPNTFPDGNETATQYTEIKTAKIREDYVGGGITKFNSEYVMGISYVARLSPYNRNSDNLATEPRWNQAGNAFFTRNFGRTFSIQFNGKYDMFTTDRLIMLKGTYNLSNEVQLSAGVNLIGTPKDGRSYWSPYTNNDAVYAGLRYIF